MDSAACIGCGACVAACKNASAALFTSAKVSHLALLPQGAGRARRRGWCAMVERHDAEGFGSCSNEGECEAVCPKEISITNIARMNREYFRAMLVSDRDADGIGIRDRGSKPSARFRGYRIPIPDPPIPAAVRP